jgi:hypothetical protein
MDSRVFKCKCGYTAVLNKGSAWYDEEIQKLSPGTNWQCKKCSKRKDK